MDYHNHEEQQQHDTPLIFNITTVDYNRKDPVFWIEAIVSFYCMASRRRIA